MKNLFKYSFVLLAALASLALASCVSEDEYAGAEQVKGMQVFFPKNSETFQANPEGGFFVISVMRADTTEEALIPLTVTAPDDCDYTVPESVKFEAGASEAEIVVTYDGSAITPGKYDEVTIALSDASYTTPYGSAVFTFKAGIAPYVAIDGKVKYRDDIICSMYGLGNPEYELDMEVNEVADSLYRIKLPYANHAFSAALFKAGITESEDEADRYYLDPETATQYMIIDARDPKHVYFYGEGTEDGSIRSGVTFNSNEGQMTFISMVQYYLSRGNSLEAVIANAESAFGTYENGVITMPKQSILMIFDIDGGPYYAAPKGKLRICMPGVKAEDFSTRFEYAGSYLGFDGSEEVYGKIHFGADVASALVTVVPAKGWDDSDALLAAMQREEVPVQRVTADGTKVGFTVEGAGKYKALVAACNSDGEIQEYTDTVFNYTPLGVSEPTWTDLYQGNFSFGVNVLQGDEAVFGQFTDQAVLSQLDGSDDTFRLVPFLGNTDEGLVFTMDDPDASGRCLLHVGETSTGFSSQYGTVYASDLANYTGDESYNESNPCYFDTNTGEFHFSLVYYVPQGAFGIEEDVYVPTAQMARALKAQAARIKAKKNVRTVARKNGKATLKAKRVVFSKTKSLKRAAL